MSKDLIKSQRLISFWLLALAILPIKALPVFAQQQSTRNPTNAEIQRLMPTLREQIQFWNRQPKPKRVNEAKSLAAAWSRVNPVVAPFVGEWAAMEQSLQIYPAKDRNRVCIVETGIEFVRFNLGTVANGQIRTGDRKVIIKQGDYLGVAFVDKNRTGIDAYRLVKPVETPTSSFLSGYNPSQVSSVVQRFKAAGCTASVAEK